jgi:hypothetical protein
MSDHTWTLGPAARAAQTSTKTVRRLLDNKTITLLGSDVPSSGSGSYSRLSRNRILQIAITSQLLAVGMSLAKAAKAAFQFTDINDSRLFDFGRTFLVIDANDTHVVNVDYDERLTDATRRVSCAIIVDCNQIVAQVDAALI